MSYKGSFKPKNPKKYLGNPSQIIYRSSWELKLMMYLDSHPDVIKWASEEFSIPYRSPVDGKIHRYFPDFFITRKNKDNITESLVVEVKPKVQSLPPKKQSRPTKRYVNEVVTYEVNQAKWKAARSFCEDRKWKFMVMTEQELGIKK